MRFKQLAWLGIILMATTALTACNIGGAAAPTVDVNAIYTQAAETALAGFSIQWTQTALANPPTAIPTNTSLATNTMLPTFPPLGGTTPLPIGTPGAGTLAATPLTLSTPIATLAGPVCNDSVFMGDVTIPDGTVMKPGTDFVKVWAIKNTGTCKWDDGYALVFISGDKMDGYDVPLKKSSDFVDPGETINFEINLTAHLAAGTYQGCWKMKDDQGFFFGTPLCYVIEVKK